MSMEGEKLWVTFKYERLPIVCYICGRFGHDDKHYMATETAQATGHQYGDWIKAGEGYKGGQNTTKPGRDERRSSSYGSE